MILLLSLLQQGKDPITGTLIVMAVIALCVGVVLYLTFRRGGNHNHDDDEE